MKNKLPILFVLTAFLSGCVNPNIPKEIKNFVNNIDFSYALNHLIEGIYNETYVEYQNNNVIGRKVTNFSFNHLSEDYYSFSCSYSFEGNQIKDNVIQLSYSMNSCPEESALTISKCRAESLEVATEDDIERNVNEISQEEAYNYYFKIFDAGVNVYKVGGLYYGDLTAVNLNKFYSYYTVNEDNTLTMKEDAVYEGNILLNQEYTIDSYGMLLHKKESASILETNAKGVLEATGQYTYN